MKTVMPIESKLRGKYSLYLGLIATILGGLLAIGCLHFLHLNATASQKQKKTDAIYAAFKNIAIDNPVLFNSLADAFIKDPSIYGVALIDSSGTIIFSRGTPSPPTLNRQHEVFNRSRLHNGKNFSEPLSYLHNNVSHKGSVVIQRSLDSNNYFTLLRIPTLLSAILIFMLTSIIGILLLSRISHCRLFFTSTQTIKPTAPKGNKNPNSTAPILNDPSEHSTQIKDLSPLLEEKTQKLKTALNKIEEQNIEIDTARINAIKADQEKSTFLANTSHETRTPINSIIGFAGLLQKTSLNEKQREYVDTIEESAKDLLVNISDVIDFSRLETGKLNLDYKPIDIIKLIEESHRFIVNGARDKNIELPLNISGTLPEKLLGDPMRFKQVYLNVLDNTLKSLRATRVTTHIEIEDRDDNQVTLKISLTAPGKNFNDPKLTLTQSILNRNKTAIDKLDTKQHMGLVIAKGLVSTMHGHIGFATKEDEGVFWFTVQLGKANATGRSTDDIEQEQKKRARILVVDDNASNRRLVSELLKDFNTDIDLAESGEEGIEMCLHQQYTFILMDIQMPGLSGFETTAIIRHNEPVGIRTPIVALTAHAVEAEKSRLLMSGMDDFISKPIGDAEIRELLSRWAPYAPAPTNAIAPKPSTKITAMTSKTNGEKTAVDIDLCILIAKHKHDLARDMLAMLIDSLPEELSSLERALTSNNHETTHDIIHRIHGGACYTGTPKLLAICAELDSALKTSSAENLAPHIMTFQHCCHELIEWRENNDIEHVFSQPSSR